MVSVDITKSTHFYMFIIMTLGIFLLIESWIIAEGLHDCANSKIMRLNAAILMMGTILTVTALSYAICYFRTKFESSKGPLQGILLFLLLICIVITVLGIIMQQEAKKNEQTCQIQNGSYALWGTGIVSIIIIVVIFILHIWRKKQTKGDSSSESELFPM